MSHGKQFTLFTHYGGPNGWKVAFVMDLLGLTYEPRYLDFSKGEVKGPEHTKYNPNGRIPTIIDHKNNDFVLWESGAIILYLLEKYDPEHKISVSSSEEKAVLYQWLFFQVSGQGPYYGQANYFNNSAEIKIPSAIQRYQDETRRILGVLESVLSKQEWLVGGKFTAADLVFVTWNNYLPLLLGEEFDFEHEFPKTFAWHSKVMAIEPIKTGFAEIKRLRALEVEKEKERKELVEKV